MPSIKPIGIIGLGLMGTAMGKRLLEQGQKVIVWNRTKDKAADLLALGATWSDHPLAQCDRVIISLFTSGVVSEVIGLMAADLRPGHLLIDTTTGEPDEVVALAKSLDQREVRYLDAPISGGAAKAASGEMTMMTAAKPAAYAKCEAMLNAMAGKVYKLGDHAGAGSKVKIINQLLAGVHIAAAAEAMALGLREGVNPEALYDVITHSAGNSWMFENRMAHVLAADYTPLSAVDIFVKDLGLVLDLARASKFPLPLSITKVCALDKVGVITIAS